MGLPKREFLQLAHTYDPAGHCIGGHYVSEKLDGMRAYWDGGLTKGQYTDQCAFANTSKDFRLKVGRVLATGLWSRYGKVLRCPQTWIDKLPQNIPLDGELYLGPGRFQELMTIVRRHDSPRWHEVKFKIFDVPSDSQMFRDGYIHVPNWHAEFQGLYPDLKTAPRQRPRSFENVLSFLAKVSNDWDHDTLSLHWQQKLSMQTEKAEAEALAMFDDVLALGGEGLILRKPESIWTPKRTWDNLKYKPEYDAEATVIGFTWGKGKLEGLFGAMWVKWRGVTFKLSGFKNEERMLHNRDGELMYGAPGNKVMDHIDSKDFPRGSQVTFKYMDLSDDGIPKGGRYFRKA